MLDDTPTKTNGEINTLHRRRSDKEREPPTLVQALSSNRAKGAQHLRMRSIPDSSPLPKQVPPRTSLSLLSHLLLLPEWSWMLKGSHKSGPKQSGATTKTSGAPVP